MGSKTAAKGGGMAEKPDALLQPKGVATMKFFKAFTALSVACSAFRDHGYRVSCHRLRFGPGGDA